MTCLDFWPKSLVDWAQILSAIATAAAVIVSLRLASRQSSERLRLDLTSETTFEFLPSHAGEINHVSALDIYVVATNVGAVPVSIQSIFLYRSHRLKKTEILCVFHRDTEEITGDDRINFGQALRAKFQANRGNTSDVARIRDALALRFEVETTTGRKFSIAIPRYIGLDMVKFHAYANR